MANKVLLKKSSVGARVPVVGDLDYGELALNYADGKLYYKTSGNTIDTFPSLSATSTLTNKTISLGSNTITGTLAQFNTAITDANIAAETHKYHEFTLNTYYYDSYAQERYFRLFTQNATYDTARYSSVTNVEYWNGTAWTAWTGGDAIVKNLLDGRDDTYADIDHTYKKFRFTINKNSGWPTNALIATYWSWFGNGWTPYTLTIEDTADSVTWTTKETLTFGNTTNTNADYGWHAFYSGNLHNGRTLNRITYDITDWTDAVGYTTKRIYALSIFSNYSGASDSIGVPVSWNYDKVVNFSAVPTVSSVQVATLTAAQTLTNKTLTSPTLTTPALGVATATSINKVAFTAPATGSTLTIADGKTLTASNSLTFTGTDSTSFAFPGTSGTVVTLAATQTLTNKTLTTPIISSISNTGTLTLPTSTDTLVGRATTDTLTNKTLTSPTINSGALSGTFSGAITLSDTTDSSSTTTGALKIGGGLGVAGKIYADQIRLTNNGAGTNVYIGDDVMLGDINAANTLGVRGIQDAANAYIVFGNANNTNYIGRTGSNPLTVTGQFAVNSGTITGGNAVALQISGYAQKGGTGYHDFLSVTNSFGSATNPNKFLRLNSTGTLEIVNSAYSAIILTLSDSGVLYVPQINAGGSTGTNGQVLRSTGTGLEWASVGGVGTVTSITAGTGLTGGTITSSGTIAIDSTVTTLTGTQTLTNKTLTSPTVNSATVNNATVTGTVTAGGSAGTSGYYLQSTGSGVQWAEVSTTIGYNNSSLSSFPSGDYNGTDSYVGHSGSSTDAFGVSLLAIFTCMDPVGSLQTTDLGVLT